MAYINVPGGRGKIYVPDHAGPRKHKCKDCFFCQMCSDTRCRTCLKNKKHKKRKNSRA